MPIWRINPQTVEQHYKATSAGDETSKRRMNMIELRHTGMAAGRGGGRG